MEVNLTGISILASMNVPIKGISSGSDIMHVPVISESSTRALQHRNLDTEVFHPIVAACLNLCVPCDSDSVLRITVSPLRTLHVPLLIGARTLPSASAEIADDHQFFTWV